MKFIEEKTCLRIKPPFDGLIEDNSGSAVGSPFQKL